jgi:hypothetical protein
VRLAEGGERMGIDRSVKKGGSFPCHRSHERAALITGCGLYATVTVAHLISHGTRGAVDVLHSLPVALLVVSFGLGSGSNRGDYRETDLELRFVRAVH